MGATPIPRVVRYVADEAGGFIDVTSYTPDPDAAFRRSVTPRSQPFIWELLNMAIIVCLLALVVIPILWWLT